MRASRSPIGGGLRSGGDGVGFAFNIRTDRIALGARRVHVRIRTSTADGPPVTLKLEELSTVSDKRSAPGPWAGTRDVAAAMKEECRAGGFVVLMEERFQTMRAHRLMCRSELR